MARERLLRNHEVYDILGVSRETVRRWLLDTTGLNFPRPVLIGKTRFYRLSEIDAWLDARERLPHGNGKPFPTKDEAA